MGFNVESKYNRNENKTQNTPSSQRGFNVQSLQDAKFELKAPDGTYAGLISYGAKTAIERGALDSYTPKDEEEKKALSIFRERTSGADPNAIFQLPYIQDEKGKLVPNPNYRMSGTAEKKEVSSNPVFERYGIDANSFNFEDLAKWAEEHNHRTYVDSGMAVHLEPKTEGGFLGIGAKKLTTEQEEADAKVLRELAYNNSRRQQSQTDLGATMSAIVGAADGMTFGAASKASDAVNKRAYEKAGLDPEDYVSPSQSTAKTVDEHKVANVVGDIGGSLATLGVLGKGVSAATKTVGWIANSPLWVQSAINSGITFGLMGGAETAIDGGGVKETLMSAGINAVGGAAGGALSSKVGDIGTKILSNSQLLRNKIIPEMIRSGVTGASFAAGKTGATYFLYPEEYRPSSEELAKDIGVAFAFAAISSGLSTMKASAQNKKYLDDLYKKMAADYEYMVKANSTTSSDGKTLKTDVTRLAKNVLAYTDAVEGYLTGKGFTVNIVEPAAGNVPASYNGKAGSGPVTKTITQGAGARFVGQDKYVKSILSELQTIRAGVNATLNGIGNSAQAPTTPATAPTTTPAVAPTPAIAPASTAPATTPAEKTPAVVPTPIPAGATPATTPTATPATTPAVTNTPALAVGDTFKDTKTGGTVRVVSRDDTNTVIERTNGDAVESKTFTNAQADVIATNSQYEKIEAPAVAETLETLETVETVETPSKNRTSAYTNDNQQIDMQFKVVSADDLIASNSVDGSINPAYPQELQPRDRSRASSQNQIRQMAASLNPARLAESTSVAEGAPIVGADNVVESGNGRTLAVKLAYENGTADAYRDYIIANAEKYGIDASSLPEKPVLVRERLTDVDRVEFTRKANESSISSLSATEQAAVDAENLTNNILGLLVPNDGGIINTPDNKSFIASVVSNVFKSEDLNSVVNAEGGLSARGLERITNAIFYKAYGDASLSARLSESLDNDMKNATNVLLNIAPKVAAVKNGIAQGLLYDFDFSSDIAGAVKLLEKCKNEHKSVEDYASQSTFFEKESGVILSMAHVFETKNRGAKQATDFYNTLLDTVIEMGNPKQMSFEVAEVYQSKEDIIDAAVRKYNSENESARAITIPESLLRPNGSEGRNDVRRRVYEVSRDDASESSESGNADRIQQDVRPGEERRTDALDEQLRPEAESAERQPEVRGEIVNADTGEYDSIREAQLRSTEEEGLLGRSSEGYDTYDSENPPGREKGNRKAVSGEYEGELPQKGIIRGQFHGTPYVFKSHEKSYVDLGIHYGTEAQAKARLADDKGSIIQGDITLNNPLVTADIFGEKAPEDYLAALIEKSELTEAEKITLRKSFDVLSRSTGLPALAKASLDTKLKRGKYRIETSFDSKEGLFVSLSLSDDAGNAYTIPLSELITRNELIETLGSADVLSAVKTGELSDAALEKLGPHLFEAVVPFEIQNLQLRHIEDTLQSFGYDGFAYRNENEGEGWSYAVFDDSQISRNDTNNKESATNVHTGVLEKENTDTDRGRKSESVQTAEKAEDSGRKSGNVSGQSSGDDGTPVPESKADTPSEESLPGRADDDGVGESDNSAGNDGGNDNIDNSINDSVKETAPADKPKNYSMTKEVAEYIDNKSPSKADNLEAIRVLHELENTGKKPTKAQLEALAKYKGWGGLSGAFSSWQLKELQEVMTEDEIKAARATVEDAYYTPTYVIDAVYKALNRLGFEGGNILEPSMGIGNFFSKMPKKTMDASKLFGVEIDGVSGRIASYLHPDAQITIDGFQNVAYKDGAFDLIVGNVPFGDIKYTYKGKKYLIHDFFFRKSLDKLADGGVMVLVTSKGTMDKADYSLRAELASQADLVAAYRLPASVFDKSAGASVATDIIIMQKKEGGSSNGVSFKNIGEIKGIAINEYFVEHPENILGELILKRNQYGKDVSTVRAVADKDISTLLTKAVQRLPKGLLNGVSTTGTVDVTEFTGATQRYTENGKNVEFVDSATGEVKTITGKKATVAKDYINLRDAYNKLINASLNEENSSTIENLRKELKSVYKAFQDKHGHVSKHKSTLSDDTDFVKVTGLEVYDTKTKSFIPSEVFEKDTLTRKKPTKADSALDALGISIGEVGKVDIKLITQLTGKSESDVLSELADKIILTPDGSYELNEVYLSGNIREKLRQVEGKKGFERNAELLKSVMPEDIKAKDIIPQFGSPWIEPKYIGEFLQETLNLYRVPDVSYDATTGTWVVQHVYGDHTLMTKKYGTSYVDAMTVAEKALNMREIRVRNRDGVTLVGETRAAQQKAEDIRNAFEEWCFKDTERRNELVRIFNEKFNSHRSMDFSALAEHLTFAGLSESFTPRDYQRRAVARVVFNGNTLLAHGVGTGKTAEMIASAMELKRLGVVKKNMMVVPNHKPDDFRNDILKMYPSAKVIMLGAGKTVKPADRQKFFAQVASGDWDICIVPHSVFGLLDVADDTKRAFIQNQIDELEEVLTLSQLEKGKALDGRFVRQLENQKKKLQAKLEAVAEAKKDKGMVFEELGVDSIFVDEAHNFKSLPFYTKLARVAGVSSSESSRAENMFMVTDYVNRAGGRVNFATATPITNSMTEIYNMIRFLRPDILKEAGIGSFDAWASMFGSIVNEAEVDPTGRNMRMKERFSKFKNVQQMVEQFRRVADVLKTGDVIEELPEVERIDVINETNDIQEEFLDILNDMVAKIQSGGQKDATLNMLTVTKAGQMAAIDLRMVADFFEGKYSLEDLNLAGNRISKVVERVYNEYTDSNDIKGTQFIFCDEGVRDNPEGRYRLNVYNDLINRLVAAGIPREEIAVAQDFTDKADLSGKVNTGEIRVLIGSTQVMGEGMNAQERAVALHHVTVPYRPSDIEQREGRIIRFGNINKNVRIYRYIQERSYDSYQWQMQERKANFINQALSNGNASELEEMSDFVLTAREAKAIASGNPLLLEKMDVEDKLNKIKLARNRFNSDKLDMQDRLKTLPLRVASLHKEAADLKADADTVAKNKSDDFKIKLYGKSFTERPAAAEHLELVLAKVPKNGEAVKVGEYLGLDVLYSTSVQWGSEFTLKGAASHKVDAGDSALGNITRLTNLANKLADEADKREGAAKHFESELKTLEEEIKAEFPQAKELAELQAKLDEINEKIGAKDEVDMSTVVVDDSDGGDADEVIRGYRSASDVRSNSGDTDTEDVWKTERVVDDADTETDDVYIPSLSELMKDISNSFGVTVATGKIMDRRAKGIFKNRAEVIRTKTANDLPTAVHELGHYFDKKYNISAYENHEEAMVLADEKFLAGYSAEEIPGEVAAEFVRRYFKNPKEVTRLCPKLTEEFLSKLSKEDAKAVKRIAPVVYSYMSAEAEETYGTTIVDSKDAKKLNLPSASDVSHALYTRWIDGFHPVKQAVDFVEASTGETATGNTNAYKLATNSLNGHNRANYILTKGFKDLDGFDVAGAASLADCLKDVNVADKEVQKKFNEYLKLKHAVEVIAEGKQAFANPNHEDPATIKRRIAVLEKEHPEFKPSSEKLYEFQHNILSHFAVKAGLITQETADFLRDKYPCYVPFNRVMDDDASLAGARKSLANQSSPIKRMKGSGRDTLNHLESIVRNTEKIITASIKHQAVSALTEYADTVDGFGAFIERIPPDQLKKTVDVTALKEEFNDRLQEVVKTSDDFFAVSELLDEVFGNEVSEYTPVVNEHKRIIAVQKGDKRQYYQVHNKELFNAITELSPKQLSGLGGFLVGALRTSNALITQYNPLFALTNPIRDARTAYKLGDIDSPAEFAKMYAQAVKEMLSNSEAYQQFQAMGGGHSSRVSAEIGQISKTLKELYLQDKGRAARLAYAMLRHPIGTVASISDFTESIPRFMAFMYTYEKTGNLQEAMYAADDITTNFKRRGSGGEAKFANGLFRFNNAALQGLDKTRRTFTDSSPERKAKTATKWIVDALLVAFVLSFFNRENDEEGWENLSSYKKNNFYNISIGDGQFISLPKERENAVLNSFIERTVDKLMGEDDAFYDFGGYLASQLLPSMLSGVPDALTLNGADFLHKELNNTLFGGLADIGFNKDFKGDPIESDYDKYKPSNERYNEGTSKLAYELGQTKLAVNNEASPKKIDHLLSFYFGFPATANKSWFPVSDSRKDVTAGLRNRFLSDGNYSTDVLNKVYDNRDLAKRDFQYYGTADKAIEYEQNAVVADYISEMNKAIRAMPEDEQRKGRGYLLQSLNRWNYNTSPAQKEMLSRFGDDKVSDDCIITDVPKSSLEWSTNKKDAWGRVIKNADGKAVRVKYAYQMTPQEYSEYVNDYLNLIEKYRVYQGSNTSDPDAYAAALESTKTEVKKVLDKKYQEKYKNKSTITEK